MAEPRLPIFKALFICDDVVADRATNKVHVVGLFDTFRAAGTAPPYRLGKLCAFAQLTDWQGELELQVRIIDATTLEQILRSPPMRVNIPARSTLVHIPFRFRNCEFPAAGVFLVELYCNGVFIDDRRFQVLPSAHGNDT